MDISYIHWFKKIEESVTTKKVYFAMFERFNSYPKMINTSFEILKTSSPLFKKEEISN